MESYFNLGCIIRKRNLLAHISIWTIAAIVLAISLTVFNGCAFGILYLTFFLSFVLTFQSSYSLWARSIKIYCIALIIYSLCICLLTYTFQFKSINSMYKQILSPQLLNDIGLVVRNNGWMLFLEPFIPLLLAILLILYLRIFNDDFNRFVYLAEEFDVSLSTPLTDCQLGVQNTINDSTFIMLSSTSANQAHTESADSRTQSATLNNGQQATTSSSNLLTRTTSTGFTNPNSNNASRIDLRPQSSGRYIKHFIKEANECIWRILETHFIKLVVFMIFRLTIVDVCLMNMPFLIIVIFALKYPNTAKCSCLTASWLLSIIVIIRNLSNLTTLRTFDITSMCGLDSPQPLTGNTYSYLDYLGLNHDTGNPLNRVDNHIIVLLLITLYSFICVHFERRAFTDYELSFGVIFTGIGRREADKGFFNTFKFFCNFGFYKFGIELTCLALIIAISNRLDSVAAIYAIILAVISITTSKRTLASVWPILTLIVALLVPVQYTLRLGIPKALCEQYPWSTLDANVKQWLYLSDYSSTQDASLLLFDFLVLLAFCRQAVVFKHMRLNSNPAYITNRRLHHDFSAHQFRVRYLPNADEYTSDDCFSNFSSQSNYLRSIFFISIYWITLAVVLVAGATKISLFSLGYLIGCFIFLWLGNDTYLMNPKKLIFSWNWFIFYVTLVMLVKTVLQLYTCFLHDYLLNHCYILQLLRVVCYRKIQNTEPSSDSAGLCAASLPYDELDILWDGLCLMFLLMQRVVFGSQYFKYLVQEVKAQQILASRGAELIMATQIEEAKAQDLYEKEVMRSIREKMENLKSDNEETSKAWKRLLTLPHHHQIIRNADKHLFGSNHDEPVSQCRNNDWKFRKAFIPDPLGDELERMADINGISAVFTRWMKRRPLYGHGAPSPSQTSNPSSTPRNEPSSDNEQHSDTASEPGVVSPEVAGTSGSARDTVLVDTRPPEPRRRLAAGTSFDMIPKRGIDIGEAVENDDNDDDDDDQNNSDGSNSGEPGRIRGWWDMINLIVYSCLLSATVALNKLSRSYRYVSRRMNIEKNILKRDFKLSDERFRRDPNWRKWVIGTISETYAKTAVDQQYGRQSNTSLHRIRSALKIITSTQQGNSSQESPHSEPSDKSPHSGSPKQHASQRTELTDPEYYFLKLNMFTQFCRALAYVFISNTSLWCQLVIIMNQVLTASLLSLPLPLMTFLWGTLSVPRPTKRFWKTVITYLEIVIVIKYVCQFPIWDWDLNNINPFYYPNLLGIKNITIVYDLILLLALFFHRSMLKSLGQWGASMDQIVLPPAALQPPSRGSTRRHNSRAPSSVSYRRSPAHSPPPAHNAAPDPRLVKSCQMEDGAMMATGLKRCDAVDLPAGGSIEVAQVELHGHQLDVSHDYSAQSSYQNQDQQIQFDTKPPETGANLDPNNPPEDVYDAASNSRSCCLWISRFYIRANRSIASFFQHVLNTPYKVQTDVYVWMFLCDFINFLILIYGFWAFGSGYTNQTVASFLNENRIPLSVLIMLLAQFASIIIDRSFYLQKNIAGKLTFQVILVIGIHLWIFFLLPFSTGHTLTLKDYWPPKAWYVFKCLYFLLSAHQIRSGYPRRVLGNCFTKSFGYANWGAFKVYRALPLIYDLRLYMDWIWTETTLEFRNWSIMEDMFAMLFIRKCELTLEEEYPLPRAKPINRLSKYLTGGAFILLILAIIWGPLLLFSMGKTVGEGNPPVELEYELEFVGFQPILRMRATAQQITLINETQYDQLRTRFVSLSSQSFLGDYKVGDVAAVRLNGQSNAVWEISPPSKELLMSRIINNETLILKSTWTLWRIKRQKSQNFDVNIAGSHQNIIHGNSSQQFRQALFDMLANSSTTQTNPDETKFVVTPPIFPNYIRVPETGQVSLVDHFGDNLFDYQPLRPLNLSYIRMYDPTINQTDNSTSWWKADDLCKYSPQNDSYSFWSPKMLEHCESLVVVAFNDRIFTGILALLSAPGIIGLYTTFVVFFARLIRTEPSGKVIYTEIPKVDRVYGLIMDTYMMRECGEFELEEKLFAKLLFLYRSPEMLIEWSKRQDELHFELNSPRHTD